MKGISQLKAKENSEKYKNMYERWKMGSTLQEIGEVHKITKQRVWQIITRCKLGDGEYYVGVAVARNKWNQLKKEHTLSSEVHEAFNMWLIERNVKIAADNHKTAPHTGWD
tara:strand:+ start:487 stop:819 length:333 start_codon:yes stop_codon:yes gene_type:complete